MTSIVNRSTVPERPESQPSSRCRTARAIGACSGVRRRSSSRHPGCAAIAALTCAQRGVHVTRPGRPRARPRSAARGTRAPARRRAGRGRGLVVASLADALVTESRPARRHRGGGSAAPARRAARDGPRRAARRPCPTALPAAGTTRIAADWRPRMSPPARSAASSAASSRLVSVPGVALECLEHRRPDALGGHDVGLAGDAVALAVAGEGDAPRRRCGRPPRRRRRRSRPVAWRGRDRPSSSSASASGALAPCASSSSASGP